MSAFILRQPWSISLFYNLSEKLHTYIPPLAHHTTRHHMPIMVKPDSQTFIQHLLVDEQPPWQPITTMTLARRLGVSLQSLANWRVRNSGPPFSPAPRGIGNKMLYRPNEVAAWLTDGKVQAWEVSARWLQRRALSPRDWSSSSTAEAVAHLEKLRIFRAKVK